MIVMLYISEGMALLLIKLGRTLPVECVCTCT